MQSALIQSARPRRLPFPSPCWYRCRHRSHYRHRHAASSSLSVLHSLNKSGTVSAAVATTSSHSDHDRDRKETPRSPRGNYFHPSSISHPSNTLATVKRHLSTANNNNNDSNGSSSSRPILPLSSIPILSKEAATAPVEYPTADRFWALPPAIAIHLSIGSVYVYSMWTPGMSKTLGVIAAAPDDWAHTELLPVFSAAAVVLGITTSALGEWVERVGPRTAGAVGSAFWGGALLTTALGVETHSLPLVYLGYGMFGGLGWGLMYLTPVTSAMKWFPDRRGLATGIALSAFGAGAALAPSIIHTLVDSFAVAPQFIGECLLTSSGGGETTSAAASLQPLVELSTLSDGSQVIATNSPIGEPGTPVVVATEADIAKSAGSAITTGPGVYVIGTGDTGIAKAMASLGALYGVLGAIGSRFMQIPHPDWTPKRGAMGKDDIREDPSKSVATKTAVVESNNTGLPASYVTTQTKQFPLLWFAVFGNATGGLALLSSSKLMLTDIFAGVAPEIVTPAFATGYVSALGVGMALGRFGWSAISDVLGRRNTYAAFGLGVPIVGMAPYLCHAVVDVTSGCASGTGGGEVWPYLMTFYGGSVLAITFYGGIFSVLPAYIADLFGQKHAGAIHGKALTAWASSAVAGPMGLAYLRSYSYDNAMQDLLQTVEAHDALALNRSFGVSISDEEAIQKLVDAKTLTIEKLMELAPVGTVDPTPFLYDTTCYMAAALMSVAAISNLAIRPLNLRKELIQDRK